MWTQALDVVIVFTITVTACWLAWHQKRRVATATVQFLSPGASHRSKAPAEGLFLVWDVAQQHKGPEHLYSGHVAGPAALLCLRLTHVAVFVSTVAYLVLVTKPGAWWLPWFTNWTFTGYGVYALLSSALTAHHWRRQQLRSSRGSDGSSGSKREPPDLYRPGPWQPQDRAVGVLLEVLCTTSIAVSVFYWTIYALCLQYCGSVGFDNAMEHGTSALLLLLDVGLSRAPINSFHLAIPVLYGCVYLIFHTTYANITGNWVYTVLMWDEPASLVFYGALPLVLMLAFGVMLCVAVARERTGPWLASQLRLAMPQQQQHQQPYLPLSTSNAADNEGFSSDTTLPGLGRFVGSGCSNGTIGTWGYKAGVTGMAIEVAEFGNTIV